MIHSSPELRISTGHAVHPVPDSQHFFGGVTKASVSPISKLSRRAAHNSAELQFYPGGAAHSDHEPHKLFGRAVQWTDVTQRLVDGATHAKPVEPRGYWSRRLIKARPPRPHWRRDHTTPVSPARHVALTTIPQPTKQRLSARRPESNCLPTLQQPSRPMATKTQPPSLKSLSPFGGVDA